VQFKELVSQAVKITVLKVTQLFTCDIAKVCNACRPVDGKRFKLFCLGSLDPLIPLLSGNGPSGIRVGAVTGCPLVFVAS
jgi:hypothetical protein